MIRTSPDPHTLAVLVLFLAFSSMSLVGHAAAQDPVPDARVTIEDVAVSDRSPEPGEFVNFSVTVSNSGGSTSPVKIDKIELRERAGGTFDSLDRATSPLSSGVGSLSPGGSLTIPLTTSFEDAGYRRLDVYVRGTESSGDTVSATRPLSLSVGSVDVESVTADVGVDARLTTQVPDDDNGGVQDALSDDLGGLGGGIGGQGEDDEETRTTRREVYEVRVTNFGNIEATDVVLRPYRGDEPLPRIAVGNLEPMSEETVVFEPSVTSPTTYRFETKYDAAGRTWTANYSTEYTPDLGRLTLTDINMSVSTSPRTGNGTRILISGNVGNTGFADAKGTVVAVAETASVDPVYPSADNFVGTIPESDFTFFELTARVDRNDTARIPLKVRYSSKGERINRTFEVPLEVGGTRSDDRDGGAPLLFVAAGAVVFAVSAAYVWRRRKGGSTED